MNPSDAPTAAHPLVAVLDRVSHHIDDASATSILAMDAASTGEVLTRLTVLEARVASLKLTALVHAGAVDLAAESGAASTAAWVAHATRTSRRETGAQTRLAAALASDKHSAVRDALAVGQLIVEQAAAIVAAVDALPDDLAAALVAKAEMYLVEQAAFFDAARLTIMGHRLLEVIAADLVDVYEAKRLEREEREAAQATRLTMGDDGHGSVFIRAKLPTRYAAMLKKILLAVAAPKHQASKSGEDVPPGRRPSPERMGLAFCELFESLTDQHLPRAGGVGATVVVTMDLETLLGGLKAAHLDTGEAISAGQARRMACEAGIIPAVLGSQSVPLDLGRKTRFHTKSQRIAIALRDGGCTAAGCDWPPGMCHTHHDPPWSRGGPTDIEHARMLCPHHHARAHDPAYRTQQTDGGKISFHRRT